LPFLYAVAALGIAFMGSGAFSLDRMLGLDFLYAPYLITSVLVLAVFGSPSRCKCAMAVPP